MFWDEKPQGWPVNVIGVKALLVFVECVDLYITMVEVVVVIDSPGHKIFDVRRI